MQKNPLLSVPYYSQRDSQSGHAWRMCYSSSNAMLLQTLKPGTLKGPNGDDEYLKTVFKYGDTTSADAQIRALRDFGINAQFRTNLEWADVDAQLEKGIPVPIGILHHGKLGGQLSGGHWFIIIGKKSNDTGTVNDDQYIVHDPYGELDLINGGYPGSHNGQKLLYSRKNLTPRWQVNGTRGWGIIAQKPKGA
jgi:hypothetical protein